MGKTHSIEEEGVLLLLVDFKTPIQELVDLYPDADQIYIERVGIHNRIHVT